MPCRRGLRGAFAVYNLYDPDPACLAMQPPLCTSSDVFSDDVDRLLITRINLLRFGTDPQ